MAGKGEDEMAAGMAAALAGLPWSKIIAAAPGLIAQGSALADRVKSRPPAPAVETVDLPAKLDAAEARLAQVETELAASARLAADLSAAQAGLIAEVDRLRRMLYGALGLGAVALVVALVAAVS
jgi:hypothetical protein